MLKYKVGDLDAVDEPYRGAYKEAEGGGYVLQVEGAVSADKYSQVNQERIDAQDEAARRRRAVEQYRELGESPDAIREAMNAASKANPDHEAVIAEMRAKHEQQVSELGGTINNMRMTSANASFKAELAKAGFISEVVDDIAAGSAGRIVFDESGEMRIMKPDGSGILGGSSATGHASLADLATELAAAKPSLLRDEGKGGGGKAPASNSVNNGSNLSGNLSSILGSLPVN